MEMLIGLHEVSMNNDNEHQAEEPKVGLVKNYPAIGSKISLLINDSLLRYSGTLHLVAGQSVVLKPVASHGTEGRYSSINQPEKEIVECLENIHEQLQFLKSDVKSIFVHSGPAKKPPSSPPTLVKHETEIADLNMKVAGLERKHESEVNDLKRQNDNFERQLRAQADLIERQNNKFEELARLTSSNSASSETFNNSLGIECVICLDRAKTIVVFPCKNLCMCNKCASKKYVTNCPVCSVHVDSKLDIVPT